MSLSPYEIETKQFVTVMRGFDPIEVGAFLSDVAEEMRGLLRALYAALPPVDASGATPDPHDLIDHGSEVAAEAARLAQDGRAALVDVAALLHQADLEVQDRHVSANGIKVRAVREAHSLMARAQAEVAAVEEEAAQRRRRLLEGLADMADELGKGEDLLREVRARLRASTELLADADADATGDRGATR